MTTVTRTARDRVRQKDWWYPMPWDDTRRTVHTETVDITFYMQEKFEQKRREARKKKYQEYQIFYYGGPIEKERKQDHMRKYLYKQIKEREMNREHFAKNVEESKRLAEEAESYFEKKKEEQKEKRKASIAVSNSNKAMMDIKAAEVRANKMADINEQKELLHCNPLNWRHTLW